MLCRSLLAFDRSVHSGLQTYTCPFPIQPVRAAQAELDLPQALPEAAPSGWEGTGPRALVAKQQSTRGRGAACLQRGEVAAAVRWKTCSALPDF